MHGINKSSKKTTAYEYGPKPKYFRKSKCPFLYMHSVVKRSPLMANNH